MIHFFSHLGDSVQSPSRHRSPGNPASSAIAIKVPGTNRPPLHGFSTIPLRLRYASFLQVPGTLLFATLNDKKAPVQYCTKALSQPLFHFLQSFILRHELRYRCIFICNYRLILFLRLMNPGSILRSQLFSVSSLSFQYLFCLIVGV